MPRWLGTLVVVAAFAAWWTISSAVGSRRAKRRREAFLKNRVPLADDEFTRELGLVDYRDQRVCCAIRHAVAKELGISSDMLRPSDDLYTLVFELQYTWPDWLAAARTAVKVEMASQYDSWYEFAQSSEGTGPLDARTFRDFLEFYIKHLNRLTHPGKQG